MMIQKSFDRTIVGLVPEKETALLAVSGGIDSICLASLFLNSSAGRRFAVAHCNFHLRGEDSDSDEALVAAWCGRNGVRYHKADFDTEQYASSHNISIEMAARELRYDWFASLCKDNGYYGVAVAHNANDNAETLILNLLRGTGLRGITGMQAESAIPVTREDLAGVRLLRPMLSFSRKQIEEYVAANSLEYHDDRTNAETVYKRNRIRHLVFPVFESLNPSFLTTFAREMNAFSEVQEIADDYFRSAREEVSEPAGKGELLRVNAVRLCNLKHYKYVLYRLLEVYGFRDRLLEPVVRLLESGKTFSGKVFEAPGYELITAGGCLIVRKAARGVSMNHGFGESCGAVGGVLDRRSRGTLMTVEQVIRENDTCSVVRSSGEYVFDGFRVNVSVSEAGADPVSAAKSLAREVIAAFSSEALSFPFLLRGWRKGDWMRPVGVGGKKKLSDLFTDLKLSLEEKSRALVVVLPSLAGEGTESGGSSSDVSDSEASRRGTDNIGTDAVRGVRVAGVCGYVSGRFFFRVDESVMVTPSTASILKLYFRAPENV